MPVDAESLTDTVRCLPFVSPLGNFLAKFDPELRPSDPDALAFARAIPAFVRSLIFWASTFAKDANKANKIFRTSSLSVARCGSV
jgi:hypothetical protein